MTKIVLYTMAGIAIIGAVTPGKAHHSIQQYYATNQSTHIEGDVVEFNYRNPHSFVELDVKDPQSGQMVRWSIEWGSLRRLEQRGVNKDSLKPGDHVIIEGYPSREAGATHRLFLRSVLRPSDGWKSSRDIARN